MKKYKKTILITILSILTLLLILLLFVYFNVLWSKNKYKEWAADYLQNRYSENMNIQEIYMDPDVGYSAEVSPENDAECIFIIKGKEVDTYLETVLEQEAIYEIESKLKGSQCYASMYVTEAVKTPFQELYDLYRQLRVPPTWENVPRWIKLEMFAIKVDYDVGDDEANNIISIMNSATFKSARLSIRDKDREEYYYLFNEETQKYDYTEQNVMIRNLYAE